MHAFMYICLYERLYVCVYKYYKHTFMYVCILCMHYVCMYVCMNVCMHVQYVCVCMWMISMYVCMYVCTWHLQHGGMGGHVAECLGGGPTHHQVVAEHQVVRRSHPPSSRAGLGQVRLGQVRSDKETLTNYKF